MSDTLQKARAALQQIKEADPREHTEIIRVLNGPARLGDRPDIISAFASPNPPSRHDLVTAAMFPSLEKGK